MNYASASCYVNPRALAVVQPNIAIDLDFFRLEPENMFKLAIFDDGPMAKQDPETRLPTMPQCRLDGALFFFKKINRIFLLPTRMSRPLTPRATKFGVPRSLRRDEHAELQ